MKVKLELEVSFCFENPQKSTARYGQHSTVIQAFIKNHCYVFAVHIFHQVLLFTLTIQQFSNRPSLRPIAVHPGNRTKMQFFFWDLRIFLSSYFSDWLVLLIARVSFVNGPSLDPTELGARRHREGAGLLMGVCRGGDYSGKVGTVGATRISS